MTDGWRHAGCLTFARFGAEQVGENQHSENALLPRLFRRRNRLFGDTLAVDRPRPNLDSPVETGKAGSHRQYPPKLQPIKRGRKAPLAEPVNGRA
ncbi:hypothetical protein AYM39_11575 [Methylomonas sp. DH-1]|nr:hypothetical protein AYM39_11575 [Methylomonas sp. DH-1]